MQKSIHNGGGGGRVEGISDLYTLSPGTENCKVEVKRGLQSFIGQISVGKMKVFIPDFVFIMICWIDFKLAVALYYEKLEHVWLY